METSDNLVEIAAGAGAATRLRAEMNLVLVFSAGPMDIVPINGENCTLRPAHYAVEPNS